MKNKSSILSLFLFLLVSSIAASGSEFGRYKGPGIDIRYDPALRNGAAALAESYPKIKQDLEAKLGRKVEFVPEVVLVRGFRDKVDSDIITAYAVPARNLIVIDYSKMERAPFDVDATLKHELCHLLLHRMIEGDMPRWLDEGVAQWASGGIADIVNPGEKDLLKRAVLSRGLIPLKKLASFPEDRVDVLLSYEESKSFIEFLVKEYGADRLRFLLSKMGEQKTLDAVAVEVFSADMNQLEEKWLGNLRRKYSWPSYLSDHIYWLLFFGAALVTLIGYLRLRRSMKNYRDEDEDDAAPSG